MRNNFKRLTYPHNPKSRQQGLRSLVVLPGCMLILMLKMVYDFGDDDHGYAEPRPLHSCCNCGVDPGKPHVNAHSVIPGDKKK